MFLTSTGTARSRHNLRQDVVEPVVTRANRLVEERGLQPLHLGITPHKLRHTFSPRSRSLAKLASVIVVGEAHEPWCGAALAKVADELAGPRTAGGDL